MGVNFISREKEKNMKKIIFSILYAFIFISTSCQKSVQEDGMTVYPADYARMAKFERVKTNELPDDSFSPQLLRHFEKGKNAQAQGKYRAAIENYTKCLDENEEFANAYVNRGNCYAKLGKFDNALDDFYQALLVERNFFTYYSRGLVYEAKGENLLA